MNVTGMLLTKLCWILQIKMSLNITTYVMLSIFSTKMLVEYFVVFDKIVTACLILNIEYEMGSC